MHSEDLLREGEALRACLEAESGAGCISTGPSTGSGVDPVFSPELADLRRQLGSADRAALDETVQHLRDLGYLAEALDPASGYRHARRLGPGDADELADALRDCYRDLSVFSDQFDYRLAPGESGEPELALRDAWLRSRTGDPLVIRYDTLARLRALTGLDGQVRLRALPADGETSLRSRHIHHLLAIYGILPPGLALSDPFGAATREALRGLRSLRGVAAASTSLVEVARAIGSFEFMAAEFSRQFARARVVVPAPVGGGGGWREALALQKSARREVHWPHMRISLQGYRQPASGARAEAQVRAGWNLFAVRFLQLGLWRSGYYLGEVDGLWGAMSDRALSEALIDHGFSVKVVRRRVGRPGQVPRRYRTVRIRDMVSPLVSGRFQAIDAARFVAACLDTPNDGAEPAPTPDDLFALHTEIEERLDALGATRGDHEAAWESVFRAVDRADTVQARRRRRRGYGLAVVGRGIARLVGWVRRAATTVAAFVEQLARRVVGAVLQAFRSLLRGLQPALQTARLAARRLLHLVSGRPFVHVADEASPARRYLVTRFHLDQDAVSVVGPGSHLDDVTAHFDAISAQNRALATVLVLGVRIVRLASTFAPPWNPWRLARLAWQAFGIVWTFFREVQERPDAAGRALWRTGMLLIA